MPIIKIRRSRDRLKLMMVIYFVIRLLIYIESKQWMPDLINRNPAQTAEILYKSWGKLLMYFTFYLLAVFEHMLHFCRIPLYGL